MPKTFTFQLTLLFNQTVADGAGDWQYAAATGVDHAAQQTVQLIATKRTVGSENLPAPASMLTATIMFQPTTAGGVPPNMTLQGIHDFTTNNESGSVSAASEEYAYLIGGTFTFEAGPPSILTINAPKPR